MSRGFVKEDDQEEVPMVPPRAALPMGTPNLVTELGLQLLEAERRTLEADIRAIDTTDERERRIALGFLNGKMALLLERINSAQVVPLVSAAEVRFGATVTYQMKAAKKAFTFKIVGVDEADVKEQKIAFVSPIAKALLGAKAGDEVVLNLGSEQRILRVLELAYI